MLPPGTMINQAYRVLRIIGTGNMGAVLLAQDIGLDREVAVKVIHPRMEGRASARDRFLREARIMACVQHDNIVPVHCYGVHQEFPYFVMEYIPGADLKALRPGAEEPPMYVAEALRIIRHVCAATSAIHESGNLHSDLKPSNVLIGPRFRVMVTDFGLAHAIGETLKDEIACTPAYASPEVLRNDRRTVACDVYSIASMVYELVTGRLPYMGSLDQVVGHKLRHPPVHPSHVYRKVPEKLGSEILRSLALDPKERHSSPQALYKALSKSVGLGSVDGPTRVVIADDDDDMRELLHALVAFSFPSCEIVLAKDGQEALKLATAAPTSLVMTDLNMPLMNGLELTAHLRVHEIPVVVVTAHGGAEDWAALIRLGARALLPKRNALTPKDVRTTLRRVFNT